MPAWQSPTAVIFCRVSRFGMERKREKHGGNGGEREMSMDAHHHGVYNERLVRSTPSQRGGRPRGGALLVGGAKSRAVPRQGYLISKAPVAVSWVYVVRWK